jgi:hypothetical protein
MMMIKGTNGGQTKSLQLGDGVPQHSTRVQSFRMKKKLTQ